MSVQRLTPTVALHQPQPQLFMLPVARCATATTAAAKGDMAAVADRGDTEADKDDTTAEDDGTRLKSAHTAERRITLLRLAMPSKMCQKETVKTDSGRKRFVGDVFYQQISTRGDLWIVPRAANHAEVSTMSYYVCLIMTQTARRKNLPLILPPLFFLLTIQMFYYRHYKSLLGESRVGSRRSLHCLILVVIVPTSVKM